MSLWKQIRSALGLVPTTGDVGLEGDRVVLRELERARAFSQEPPAGPREMSRCERCERPLRRVVFTTAGAGAQIEIWRAYPLAIDGWLCPDCGWSALPRFISKEESVEFGRRGAEHAAHGELDDAEFWFRRIVSSWPGYFAGYADMGQLESARADAADDPEEKADHRAAAEGWLRRAVKADEALRAPGLRVALARALALVGKEEEALTLLHSLLEDEALPAPVRAEADELALGVREGKALFSRATQLAGKVVLEPPSQPLTPKSREALEQAATLLRESRERDDAFATNWYLGKVSLRLGRVEEACAALEHAHALQPDQPDGCRELGAVYLELGRAHDALPIARRAVELRPVDAGLRSNLALTLLLAGDVEAARDEVTAALAMEPGDSITAGLAKLIEDVAAGRLACPRSMAEAERRPGPRSG